MGWKKSVHKQGSFEEDEEFEIDSIASPNSFDVTTDETSNIMKPSSKRGNRGRSLIRLIKLESPSKKMLDQVRPAQKASRFLHKNHQVPITLLYF